MAESTSIKLRDGMRERLKTVAGKKNRTPNWVMREAIEQYLTREEAEAEFRREAQESYQEYLATGLHVTQDEMDVWFDAIARGENPPMPKPHK